MADWSEFVVSGILVLIRVSGLMLFAPFFSSTAIPRMVKAVFTVCSGRAADSHCRQSPWNWTGAGVDVDAR